jgi:hypothetical protein
MATNILSYTEGLFTFKPELMESDEEVTFSIATLIRLLEGEENFGVQITLRSFSKDKQFLEYGFVLPMRIEGWIPVTSFDSIPQLEKDKQDEAIRDLLYSRANNHLRSIAQSVILFSQGALSAKTWSPDHGAIPFPTIDIDKLLQTIHYRLFPSKKEA